jgi:hypothetical protein
VEKESDVIFCRARMVKRTLENIKTKALQIVQCWHKTVFVLSAVPADFSK